MASYTGNLNLKNPDGDEKVLVTDINENNNKIDRFAGTVTSALDKVVPSGAGAEDQILRNNGSGGAYWAPAASQSEIDAAVSAWLTEHVPTGQTVAVDTSLSVSGAAADSRVTGSRLGLADKGLETLNKESMMVKDCLAVNSITNFFPQIDSTELVSGQYLKDGELTTSTAYSYINKFIEIEGGKTYTLSLVPAYGSANIPAYGCSTSGAIYDSNHGYIMDILITNANPVFTAPIAAKYIKINVSTGAGIFLDRINGRCMLSEGSTVPATYKQYDGPKTYYILSDEIPEIDERLDDLEETVSPLADLGGTVEETTTKLNALIGNNTLIRSANKYNPSLQTPSTISPHYYVDGVPYSSTQFDSSFNCTALIPVKPSTQYIVGLVPAVGGSIVKPWANAGAGAFGYDENGDYVQNLGTTGTFTTNSNVKFIRFNYAKGNSVSLDVLNTTCMLVEGTTLPETYQAYGDKLNCDLLTKIDSLGGIGFEYKFSDGDLLIGYGYNDSVDIVVVMNNGRANGLWDFSKIGTKEKGLSLAGLSASDLTNIWTSGTDMHGPFQFNAVNNPDGYYPESTSPGWVGGNHTLDQMGNEFKTATSKYVKFYADGREVSSGYGYCARFEIRWANDVQAYNTVKRGGGGRACLTEYHDMIFDGVRFNETVKLVPLEDIDMRLWYGFQFVSWGGVYTKLRFIDADNRGVNTAASAESGSLVTAGMEAYGDNHKIILMMDCTFDLGKRQFSTGSGAFVTGGKGYFRTVTKYAQNIWEGNTAYYMRGSFRFCPAINVS